MNKTTIGIGVVALIIGIGTGYVGAGMAHSTPSAQFANGNFQRGATGGGFGGTRGGAAGTGTGFLAGTVAAKDSGSVTIDTRDGSSHVVLITPATTVSKSVSGALSDVSVGSTVMISGTTNSDGSLSASLIQLRPASPAQQ